MFAAQRLERIRSLLLQHKTIDIATLCSVLNVSNVTVRKDFDILEAEGFLKKIHGGAVLIDTDSKSPISSIELYEEKDGIAQLALKLVEEGDSVFLGSGSTCYLFSKKLPGCNINIVTSNISALGELVPHLPNTYIIGGNAVQQKSLLSSTGSLAFNYLDSIYISKSFITVDGVDKNAGLTVNDHYDLLLIQKILEISKKVIILVDSSKFGKIALHRLGSLSIADTYITNPSVDDFYKVFFYENNIKLLTKYDI